MKQVLDNPFQFQSQYGQQWQGSSSDQQLTRQIRKAIERDPFVSVAAKNVQVFVEAGTVILKGDVFVEEEKMALGNRASYYAGMGRVINQLEVIEEWE